MKLVQETSRRDLAGPLGLLTDLCQLTMACGYWKQGLARRRGVFHASFRSHPFRGGFTVAAGLGPLVEYLRSLRFAADDVGYLATLAGHDGTALFPAEFLAYLAAFEFTCDVDAVPEGTVVFPHEPLVRVTGDILQCQLIETALLNMINFPTLVATKAARICLAARGEPVLEFGLRRAQGIDGAMTASRSAYIGGCAATSNVLAGKCFGIPLRGTHAHSWVMCFDSELESFEAWAAAMPKNCVLLVDTFNTLEGVRNACRVGVMMREAGKKLVGIRLDSGDLAYLSIEARKLLDAAGLQDATIIASNDLDEELIRSLKDQGAKIGNWAVGTKLVTAFEQPALGGVYKLGAVQNAAGEWVHKIKLSEQIAKTSIPGKLQVRRYRSGGYLSADMLVDELAPVADGPLMMIDPQDDTRRKSIAADVAYDDLLVPIFRAGELVYALPALPDIRQRAREQIGLLHPSITRVENPHLYPVGLERSLFERRRRMILEARVLPV